MTKAWGSKSQRYLATVCTVTFNTVTCDSLNRSKVGTSIALQQRMYNRWFCSAFQHVKCLTFAEFAFECEAFLWTSEDPTTSIFTWLPLYILHLADVPFENGTSLLHLPGPFRKPDLFCGLVDFQNYFLWLIDSNSVVRILIFTSIYISFVNIGTCSEEQQQSPWDNSLLVTNNRELWKFSYTLSQ